jgi:hypothetical protein
MAYIGLVIDRQYAAAACGRRTAELHVTLAHIPTGTKESLQDEIPGQILLDLDMLWAYTTPQSMTLGSLERFGAILVRRVYGAGIEEARDRVRKLLDVHGVRYSNDYDPWTLHCSIGINYPPWHWVTAGEHPSYMLHPLAVHSSHAVFAGLKGVVAHRWQLGTALRDSASSDTIVED